MVYQLIYHSQYTGTQGSLSVVRDILTASQRNNSRHGITGFLIFDKTSFLQILEGDAPAVLETYERIKTDQRHAQLSVIAADDVAARAFPDWAMGGFLRSPEVQPIYTRYGIDKGMAPQDLTREPVVSLAHALMSFEAERQGGRVIDLLSPDYR